VRLVQVLGVHDVVGFDFLEPPSQDQLFMALRMLHTLGALDDDGKPTPLGLQVRRLIHIHCFFLKLVQMSRFPLEPNISRMLIAANDNGCTDEVLTIAAMLSAENIWLSPATVCMTFLALLCYLFAKG
jgi:HrpA-like RNA helicase